MVEIYLLKGPINGSRTPPLMDPKSITSELHILQATNYQTLDKNTHNSEISGRRRGG